jgi:hypothetical protein
MKLSARGPAFAKATAWQAPIGRRKPKVMNARPSTINSVKERASNGALRSQPSTKRYQLWLV